MTRPLFKKGDRVQLSEAGIRARSRSWHSYHEAKPRETVRRGAQWGVVTSNQREPSYVRVKVSGTKDSRRFPASYWELIPARAPAAV